MKTLDRIALVILIIGGVNWLLVGLIQFDLVAEIFGGQDNILARIVYVLVGLAALYCLKYLTYGPRGYDDDTTTNRRT
ncbi:MAG: DUF378 domain-containing protein [Alkalibacterium sp.]|nr:DUF378 domain-containing protein [Alkalibacterium sp.]